MYFKEMVTSIKNQRYVICETLCMHLMTILRQTFTLLVVVLTLLLYQRSSIVEAWDSHRHMLILEIAMLDYTPMEV